MNKDRFLAFIRQQVSEDVAQKISDALYAAYARAEVLAKEEIKALGHERMRAYMRREFVNDVLAQLGEAKHTNPKGEKYGLLQFNAINMLAFCVDPTRPERPANYKKELAEMNKVLEPEIPDLFDPNSELARSSLHTCLMVINPKFGEGDPRHPRDILLVVPYTNRKGFHLQVRLRDWLESYKDDVVEPVDFWPTFRKEILETEKDDQQD